MSTIYLSGLSSEPTRDTAETLINLLVAKGLTVIDVRPTSRGIFLECRNHDEAQAAINLLDGATVERRRVRAAPARSGWTR